MASAIIHMAVAHEVNKITKKDNKKYMIGSIAPDISKLVGESRDLSHFIDDGGDIPNIDKFLKKYKNNLSDDFVFGYFVHLYTDYLWFKYFIPEVYNDSSNYITKLDGTKVKCNGDMVSLYIYNDYTNLNIRLLDEYNMDLSIFYEELPSIDNIIDEIPMDKLQVLIDKISLIIKNTRTHKDFIFDIDNVKKFVETSVDLILAKLKELGLV